MRDMGRLDPDIEFKRASQEADPSACISGCDRIPQRQGHVADVARELLLIDASFGGTVAPVRSCA